MNPRVFTPTFPTAFVFAAALATAPCTAFAGDILRGGATTSNKRAGKAGTTAGAEAAALTKKNAQDRLARTTQALQEIRALQQEARAAARPAGLDPNNPGLTLPNVPDGLGPGALDLLGTPTGAGMPQQSGFNVTIQQMEQQALLNWRTFNVGKNTTLNFDQSAGKADRGKWIAFNKVFDPFGRPSQILGSIKADGQVYVINQNGIIFGAGSQVNVHTLVASSLPINDNLVKNGLLNNPDSQFLFSALPLAAGNNGTPAFTPPAAFTPDGRIGDIVVEAGAQLTAPTSAAKTGGRIALIGANVRNAGTISTPDGQTILAAGLQVGMTAHDSNDPSLRGLDVWVGSVSDYAGRAENTGLIETPRASVVIAGRDVRQLGGIDSTTSVSLNGRIDLLANYNAISNPAYKADDPTTGLPYLFQSTGLVTLGPGSVSRILPETWSEEKTVGTELALRSQINLQGRVIHLGSNAAILAPNAQITAKAGMWGFTPSQSRPLSQFILSGGQIYLEPGALIDAAGTTGVSVPLSQHILTVQLRGAELADSPLQRDASLRGVSLTIDARKTGTYNGRSWVGTPLGDAIGFLDLIERSAGQLTTVGGSVNLLAGGSVVLSKGSIVDVSGGWVNYEGGRVKTTRLLYRGHLINIEDATPDRLYDGIFDPKITRTHAKWGITKTYTIPLAPTGEHYEQPYLHGAAGGSLSISAPSMALDGTLAGNTVAGPRQQRKSATESDLPESSSLSLAFKAQDATTYVDISPTPPRIVFQPGGSQTPADGFALDAMDEPMPLRADRQETVILSPELLTANGFGKLTVDNADGDIDVPAEVELAAPPGGAISLSGANINIQGKVSAPAGSLSFTVHNISPYLSALELPPASTDRGLFTLGAAAALNAAGLIVDDRVTAIAPYSAPILRDGGSVTITTYSADLAEGSEIDVSGGVSMSAHGERHYGDAGSIAIVTGQDPTFPSVVGGKLSLKSVLKGHSRTKGGSLTLQATLIQIGGHTSNPATLLLTPDFFSRGGFSQFTLNGLGMLDESSGEFLPAIYIAPSTVIEPVAESVVAVPHGAGGKGLVLEPRQLPQEARSPVSLSFNALGVKDSFTGAMLIRGDVVMGEGSVIRTDPLASVSFKGDTVAIFGSVYAPGGSISITGASNSLPLFGDPFAPYALPTVYISPHTVLSAAGTVVLRHDPFGRRRGVVLPGGTITVSGNIVAEAGAILDVSGASGTLDLTPWEASPLAVVTVPRNSGLTRPPFSLSTVPTRVDSDGGTITLKGGQMLFSDATLLGRAGGPSALGGTLSVASGRFFPEGAIPTGFEPNLVVTQDKTSLPASYPFGHSAIGRVITDASGTPITQMGYFAANTFLNGGFDSLELKGIVQFSGPVDIEARGMIAVADGGLIYADSAVNLSATYIKLGMPFKGPVPIEEQTPPFGSTALPLYIAPTYGPGSLTVKADLIDIGTLSLQNIGKASLIADGGEIRGDGIFNIAGDLYLRAGQIYPATAVSFTIAAYEKNIKVASSTTGNPVVTLGSATLPPGFGVGSPLLGSTVQSINGAQVILASGAARTVINGVEVFEPGSGSVTIASSGVLPLPLSAGGVLNIYASTITQGGVLRAPLGSINLGWNGEGTAPADWLAGNSVPFPVTRQVTLAAGSVTSVSAIDPLTGAGVLIPYGLNLNGTSWIDPTGLDITAGGVPQKSISIAGLNLNIAAGSLIDIRGGGDLYAYRWDEGLGGTHDILASTTSFAVIPGYGSNFIPRASNTTSASATNLGGDPGYVNNSLKAGDRIYLQASDALPAGYYTLLPARYALLPGAVLVTPKTGSPRGTIGLPDGSHLVAGYRYNALNKSRAVPTLASWFEVASSQVVRSRATYEDYHGSTFLKESALAFDVAVPRLPVDAGHLILQATQSLNIEGRVLAQGWGNTGRAGLVDIASPVDIVITGPGVKGAPGVITLDATRLSSFGAESLLIGGVRNVGANGTTITVKTSNITVNNAGSPLTAPDIILVARQSLTLVPGAQIIASGPLPAGADNLFLGNAAVPGSGNGTLLRATGDMEAQIFRSGLSSAGTPKMTIGAGATIGGLGITLDSTYATSLDPQANLIAAAMYLNSGQISLRFNNPGALQPTVGLVLEGGVLQDVQAARLLSLLSYSSIDIYGTGVFNAAGRLALHAAEIRGFNNGGGTVSFNAPGSLLLDNSPGRPPVGAVAGLAGTLEFNAQTIRLGANQLNVVQYENLRLNAPGGIIAEGAGGLATQGALAITAPLLTAGSSATQSITAGGSLVIQNAGGSAQIAGGLGGSLTLQGANILATTPIVLPSGLLTLHATTGDLLVGGRLDVGGTEQAFYDVIKYTDAGQVSLIADNGSVVLSPGSFVNAAARPGGGNAGGLSISTPSGSFTLAGTMSGLGGAGGLNGSFTLDAGSLPSLSSVNAILNAALFTESRSIRVRSGDILIDGLARARNFHLSADQGSITVSGVIDASGVTGGSIILQANGDVTLLPGSLLTVAGLRFSNAGKGGDVTLEAGAQSNGVVGTGVVDIQTGAVIDLSVASRVILNADPVLDMNTPGSSAWFGQFSGKLHIRAPQNAAHTDLLVNPINGTIIDASSILIEGYRLYDLTDFGGTITSAVQSQILTDGQAFMGAVGVTTPGYTAMTNRLLAGNPGLAAVTVIAPGAELINAAAAASLNFTLSAAGNALTIPATGGTVYFPNGTPGSTVIRAPAGAVITSPTGATTVNPSATTNIVLAPGSSVTLNGAGNITYFSGAGGPITVSLTPGSSYTTSASGVAGAVSAQGSSVTLNAANTSIITLAAGTVVTFPNGTPGASRIRSNVAGTITSPTGAVTVLPANTNTAIEAGSYVTLNSAGTITSSVVSGGAIPVALASGSFTTSGAVTATPASGDLTLGALASTTTSDWNLATYRFGPKSAPGVLTLRAAGNLVFFNALSDGFTPTLASSNTSWLYQARPTAFNPLLPVNTQSWSYRLAAGSDVGAADFRSVLPLDSLGLDGGSLKLGKDNGANAANPSGSGALTSQAIANRYQVIRTGSGDIDISTGRSVQLLNQFATIYTAGTLLSDATMGGLFSNPSLNQTGGEGVLGANQQPTAYPARYTMAGGDVTIEARQNIEHLTRVAGVLVADSQHELPNNWLYRRGYINPQTGAFGIARFGDVASTSWWVDFSNFFQGIGALGGGDVTLIAGRDISNVDAVIPTNARMIGKDSGGNPIAPNAANLVELGGGDLLVKAGRNIDAGVYYVERGLGALSAGADIVTNSTRSPSTGRLTVSNTILDSHVWLPTTLFLGKGGFDVSARGNVLLGPVANVFLLPQGINNTYWYKTYFSTYSAESHVNVSSLGGSVTLRTESAPSGTTVTPLLQFWIQQQQFGASGSASWYQPWLRLSESSVIPFSTLVSIMPGTLRTTAYSGDINLAGNLTLFPSPTGTVELLAGGAINGLQPNGRRTLPGGGTATAWSTSRINLSDANPAAIPGIASPYAYQTFVGTDQGQATDTSLTLNFLDLIDRLFRETGSTSSVIQIKQALHTPGLLHKDDASPLRLYALDGNISGFTLFSPKFAQIFAQQDISDIAFYIQNNRADDISIVASGRDIIPYNANSLLRASAQAAGNILSNRAQPQAGDIQIGGPGALEVLAGRNLDLGTGANNADGTGTGISSIGNARNPYLGFAGADLVVGAGIGFSAGLAGGSLDFDAFFSSLLVGENGKTYLGELQDDFSEVSFEEMSAEMQARLALKVFYLILRDAGRAFNTEGTAAYDSGFAAIASLFGPGAVKGDITTRSRDIRTKSGGDINIFAPGGELTLAKNTLGSTLAPPGIVTEGGGDISIFTHGDVDIGIGRIFTLRGGNAIIWSSIGDIAAGSAAKTIKSAPPTRVVIDPQSADVQTDLAGLATGGGIGVLATVAGVEPGDVDLIAPVGTVDAGDAGIRATGNLTIAATRVLNADNITVGGQSTGVPAPPPPPPAPNIAGLTSASNTAGAAANAANQVANQARETPPEEETPSIITVEVLGYGGGEDDSDLPTDTRP